MSTDEGTNGITPGIRKFTELLSEIRETVVSGVSIELNRYSQDETKLRFKRAFRALRDASDGMEWIVKNEARLLAGRMRLVSGDVSHLIADFTSQKSPKA